MACRRARANPCHKAGRHDRARARGDNNILSDGAGPRCTGMVADEWVDCATQAFEKEGMLGQAHSNLMGIQDVDTKRRGEMDAKRYHERGTRKMIEMSAPVSMMATQRTPL
ncbi:hypothetical protein Emag_007880 [Eimeria magna]